MTETSSTVTVKNIDNLPAIKLTCQDDASGTEMRAALDTIYAMLGTARQTPVYVVVDITHSTRLPLLQTLQKALDSCLHQNMGQWLIVGDSPMAETLAQTLSGIMGRQGVRRFSSEPEALRYLALRCGVPAIQTV